MLSIQEVPSSLLYYNIGFVFTVQLYMYREWWVWDQGSGLTLASFWFLSGPLPSSFKSSSSTLKIFCSLLIFKMELLYIFTATVQARKNQRWPVKDAQGPHVSFGDGLGFRTFKQTPASRELSKNSCLMRYVTVARCLAWTKCPDCICLGVIDNNKFKLLLKYLAE